MPRQHDSAPSDEQRFEQALALHRRQQLDPARKLYLELLERHPDHLPTLNLLAQLALQQGDAETAQARLAHSLALDGSQLEQRLLRASALRRLKRFDEALAELDAAIARAPQQAAAHNNRGLLLHESLGQPLQALASFEQAMAADAAHAGARFNAGNVLRALGRVDEALACYDAAIALQPTLAGALNNRGTVLLQQGRAEPALADFTRLAALDPQGAHPAWMQAQALQSLGRFDAAIAAHDRVLALQPQRADAWTDRGVALRALGRTADALHSYEQAIALAPARADLQVNRANALRDLGRLEDAVAAYDRALQLDPGHGLARAQALHTRMELCDWDNLDARIEALASRVQAGETVGPPFALLAAIDDPALHLRAARTWAVQLPQPAAPRSAAPHAAAPHSAACQPAAPRPTSAVLLPSPAVRPTAHAGPHVRVRIGYCSSDFGDHPTSHLLAGVLEQHDRQRFEVLAFAFGPPRHDAWRHRIERAADRFIDLAALPDGEALARLRTSDLDVAIDLNGWTRHHRAALFSARCAPVQVGYLGYLGSSGLANLDYLVTDAAMVPAAQRRHLSEKVLQLPSYQCNDRVVPADLLADPGMADGPAPSRADAGLPAKGFVFASFNTPHKLTPAVFDGWLRILQRVPHSVLWLYVDNAPAVARLQARAAEAGIAPQRLVIAPRVPLAQHLARLPLADLMLDTFPYNAGATASNALRAGLPLLTRAGDSIASRMGASLLQAVGLSELITGSAAAYEDLAVALATDATRLAGLRTRLQQHGPNSRLFDTAGFTRSLEAALAAAVARNRAGLAPDHLVLD